LFSINSNILNFAKVRGSWAKVGGTGILGPYQLEQTYSYRVDKWGDVSLLYNPETLSNPNIKPESKTSLEFGADLRFSIIRFV
jgi:hypothetical protein